MKLYLIIDIGYNQVDYIFCNKQKAKDFLNEIEIYEIDNAWNEYGKKTKEELLLQNLITKWEIKEYDTMD